MNDDSNDNKDKQNEFDYGGIDYNKLAEAMAKQNNHTIDYNKLAMAMKNNAPTGAPSQPTNNAYDIMQQAKKENKAMNSFEGTVKEDLDSKYSIYKGFEAVAENIDKIFPDQDNKETKAVAKTFKDNDLLSKDFDNAFSFGKSISESLFENKDFVTRLPEYIQKKDYGNRLKSGDMRPNDYKELLGIVEHTTQIMQADATSKSVESEKDDDLAKYLLQSNSLLNNNNSKMEVN